MASSMHVSIKYATTQKDYGGPLEVNKFRVRRSAQNELSIAFLGSGYLDKASMSISSGLAVPLARAILSVAEGYVSKVESEVS